jgi:hypothetical protein
VFSLIMSQPNTTCGTIRRRRREEEEEEEDTT